MDFASAVGAYWLQQREIITPPLLGSCPTKAPPTLGGARFFWCTNAPHRCDSDIRFEIAATDDKEFLKFLKAREAFMRVLIKRLDKAEMEGVAAP